MISPADGHRLVELIREKVYKGVFLAGSLRRGKTSEHDVDLVVVDSERARFTTRIYELGGTLTNTAVRGKGMIQGLPLDVVYTPLDSAGSAVLFYTGSKSFNIRCRSRAKAMGLKLNERGLWFEDGSRVEVYSETEILNAIGLPFSEPRDRN